jgi:hypothetical protein
MFSSSRGFEGAVDMGGGDVRASAALAGAPARAGAMQHFLTSVLTYPTVVFTTLLGIAMCYWLLVIVGALGMDVLGGAEGHEGAAEGDLGHGDAGHDTGHADAGHDAHGAPGVAHGSTGLAGALKLRSAPLTVVISLVIFFAWVLSLGATSALGAVLAPLGAIAGGSIVLLASLVCAVLLTSFAVRPLAPLFRVNEGGSRRALVGKVCTIVTTGGVDDKFGQARLYDAGTEYTLRVRADVDSGLHRGDRALVVDYDDDRDAYVVEPMDEIVGEKKRRAK